VLRRSSEPAGLYGNSKWCAVMNEGGGVLNWDCEYEMVDNCTPAVLAGNRGFCQLNPYWRGTRSGRRQATLIFRNPDWETSRRD
jgi:hypothetical protein